MGRKDSYYDTSAFINYTFKEDVKAKYQPEKTDKNPCISLIVLEEFLHAMAGNKEAYSEYEGVSSFLEAWEKMNIYKDWFETIYPDERRVYFIFNKIIKYLINEYKNNFEKKYKNTIINGNDAVHLAIAEDQECEILITADKDFKNTFDSSETLPPRFFKNLKKIITVDEKGNKIHELSIQKLS